MGADEIDREANSVERAVRDRHIAARGAAQRAGAELGRGLGGRGDRREGLEAAIEQAISVGGGIIDRDQRAAQRKLEAFEAIGRPLVERLRARLEVLLAQRRGRILAEIDLEGECGGRDERALARGRRDREYAEIAALDRARDEIAGELADPPARGSAIVVLEARLDS